MQPIDSLPCSQDTSTCPSTEPDDSSKPPTHFLRSILILSSHLHLGLPSGLLPSGFTTKFSNPYQKKKVGIILWKFWFIWLPANTVEETPKSLYEGVTKSFRTGLLERELKMVQLSATRCSCVAIL